MMTVTTTFCHATELTGWVKHIDDKWTPTHFILGYLATHTHRLQYFYLTHFSKHIKIKAKVTENNIYTVS